jgi:hypothetical protein
VIFSVAALLTLAKHNQHYPTLKNLIEQVLSQDPRPAYKQKSADDKIYGMTLYDFNIKWQMTDIATFNVLAIEDISNK